MAIQPAINYPLNCGIATTSEFARQFSKRSVADRTADLQFFAEYKLLSSGTSESVQLGDINYTRDTYPTSATNIRVVVEYLPEKFAAIDLIQSSDTEVLSNPESSDPTLLEYQSSDTTQIEVTFNTNEKIRKSVTTSTLAESTTQDIFQSFATGSLGRHLYDQVRQYADESTSPPNHYPIYSAFNFSSNSYTKNTGCWVSGLDFSGLMVNKNGSSGVTMVTAITPHHALGVTHYPPQNGDIIYFCDQNNNTVARTVEAVTNLFNIDCCVVRFTEALPNTVKKYKTLPSNYENYLPINRNVYNTQGISSQLRASFLPLIVTSHYRWDADWSLQRPNRYAYVYQSRYILDGVYDSIGFEPAQSFPNSFPNYNGEPSGIRGGDSGGPCFFIINNDLILVHSHTSGGGGVFLPSILSQIQSAINSLGPSGQTLETVDLSGFTDFSS